MRVLKQNPWLPSLGVLLAAVVVGGYARADVTTDEPGSIVIFPKVISDGTRDTLIQLTNTSTSSAHLHCIYVDTSSASQGTCSGTTPPAQLCGPTCVGGARDRLACQTDLDCQPPSLAPGVCGSADAQCFANDNGTCITCKPYDFDVSLSPLQPTVWRVSVGRDSGDQSLGFFIGAVPPHPIFAGELKCFQTDIDGVPTGGNAIKGEATIENLDSGQISEYNGIAIKALPDAAGVAPICFGGGNDKLPCVNDSTCAPLSAAPGSCSSVSPHHCIGGGNDGNACRIDHGDDDCHPANASSGSCKIAMLLDNSEYNACPKQLLVNHYAEGAADPFTGAIVDSELTLVPCTEDLAGGVPTTTTVHFDAYNEFESLVTSKIVPFTCWLNISLGDSRLTPGFDAATFATPFGKTRVFPTSDSMSGVLGVLEEFHQVGTEPDGTAAINLHVVGARPGDTITLPAVQ